MMHNNKGEMSEKNKEIALGVLSAGGIIYIVSGLFVPLYDAVFMASENLTPLYVTIISHMVVLVVSAYLVWHFVKVGSTYRKWFLLSFILTWGLTLTRVLVAIM